MAKEIAWEMLKEAIPDENIDFKNETDLKIKLKGYGSVISLKGCENPDALRGSSLSFVVVDEMQDVPIEVIDMILRPAMGDQMADGLYIGTPKGMGDNTAYQLYLRGKSKKGWKSWQSTSADGGNIPLEEIEAAREVMAPKQFKQEYEACHLPTTLVALHNGGVKQVSAIEAGDKLVHINSFGNKCSTSVLASGATGTKAITKVILETGEEVLASSNHNFKVKHIETRTT